MVMVVEEPAVAASFADCGLNRIELHNGHDNASGRMRELMPLKASLLIIRFFADRDA
jgi:hypothetical protein